MPATCCRCSVDISDKDLAAGFAVKVPTGLVCAGCIDAMSEGGGSAQLSALKGVGSITYAVRLPRLPRLKLYSFTTAGGIANHRRTIGAGQPFKAPPLPRPELLKAAIERARNSQRSRRTAAIAAVAGGTVIVGVGIAFLTLGGGRPAPAVAVDDAPAARYQGSPFQQLAAAMQDPACPPAEMERLLGLVRKDADYMLGEVAKELDRPGGDRERAERFLGQLSAGVLAHPTLAGQRERAAALLARLDDRPVRRPAPETTPEPAPPAPAPVLAAEPPDGRERLRFPADRPLPAFAFPAAAEIPLGSLGGGRYRVWVFARRAAGSDPMLLRIGGQELPLRQGPVAGWKSAEGLFRLDPGEHVLRIAADGQWTVRGILVAGAGAVEPDFPPAEPPRPDPAPAPPAPTPTTPPSAPAVARTPFAQRVDASRFSGPVDRAGTVRMDLGPVPAGTYQLWFDGGHAQANAELRVTIGDRQLAVQAKVLNQTWGRVAGDIVLPGGPVRLAIVSERDGWFLREVYLADAASPPPGQRAVRPADPAPSAAPGAADGARLADILGDAPGKAAPSALVAGRPRSVVPSPWPADLRTVLPVRMNLPGRPRAGIDLPLPPGATGVVAALHPNRTARKAVAVSLWARRRQIADLGLIPVAGGWQRLVVAVPATAAGQAGEDPLSVRIEDTVQLTSSDSDPLLVWSVSAVVGGPLPAPAAPTPALRLDLQGSRTVQGSVRSILGAVRRPAAADIVTGITTPRREILVVGGDASDDWKGGVRKAIDRTGDHGVIRDLRIDPGWWPSVQFDLKADGRTPARSADFKPAADPKDCSLVVIIPNLTELGSAMDAKRLSAWATTLAQQIIRGDTRAPAPANAGGLWPVFAIGAIDPDQNQQNPRLADLWGPAIEELARAGVPVIDLRGGQRERAGDTREATAAILAAGLEQIRYQFAIARGEIAR